jgi:hypothetical protein
MAITAVFPFDVHAGRMDDAIGLLQQVKKVSEQLGGQEIRLMRSAAGGNGGNTVALTTSFENMAAYGKYMDAWNENTECLKIVDQIQGKNAPADSLASEVYQDIPL